MKTTGILRPLDSLGRVVLPVELRRILNIQNKDFVEIFVDGEYILLKKHQCACVFCGKTDSVTEYRGKAVCAGCLDELTGCGKTL